MSDRVVKMDELFKNNIYKILELFIEFPNNDFSKLLASKISD